MPLDIPLSKRAGALPMDIPLSKRVSTCAPGGRIPSAARKAMSICVPSTVSFVDETPSHHHHEPASSTGNIRPSNLSKSVTVGTFSSVSQSPGVPSATSGFSTIPTTLRTKSQASAISTQTGRYSMYDCFGAGEPTEEELAYHNHLRNLDPVRRFLYIIVMSQAFEKLVGFVIVANYVSIVVETDARVKASIHEAGAGENPNQAALEALILCNQVFLMFYILECLARIYIQRGSFFVFKWNLFDLAIVIFGIVEEILNMLLTVSPGETVNTQILRSMRVIRLLRASRLLVSFPELYSLVHGLMACMKTLIWAFGLVLFALTLWSIIAMEFVQPLMHEFEDYYQEVGCRWCPNAFDDIMLANLTLFQIVTGDGWSLLCRPLIEKYPGLAVLFIGIIFTMVFGLLNLITAVIVDTAARAREDDIISLVHFKDIQKNEAEASFLKLCHAIDKDASGDLSIEELRQGMKDIPELRAHLTNFGIDDENLPVIYEILDQNGDGSVTHTEFAKQLQKMRAQEPSTSLSCLGHYIHVIRRELGQLQNSTSEMLRSQVELMKLSTEPVEEDAEEQASRGTVKPPPKDCDSGHYKLTSVCTPAGPLPSDLPPHQNFRNLGSTISSASACGNRLVPKKSGSEGEERASTNKLNLSGLETARDRAMRSSFRLLNTADAQLVWGQGGPGLLNQNSSTSITAPQVHSPEPQPK